MRKGIDYPGISIVYLCHDGRGNILFQKRSKNCRDEHGCWDIGAGALELGDSVEETLKKEIKEEYCTDVLAYEFLGYRDVHRVNNEEKTHWVGLDFIVYVDRDKVRNGEPNKFEGIGWYRLGNLPQPSHSQFPNFLKLYKAKLEEKLVIFS